jgi:membrane protease YdiL (CAAX protease family)
MKSTISILLLFVGFLITQMIITFMYRVFPMLVEVIPTPLQSLIMKLTPLPPAMILWHFIERKPLCKMGLSMRGSSKNFLYGSLLGLISTTVIVLLLYLFGTIKLNSTSAISSFSTYLIWQLLLNFGTAIGEEVMFRGYVTGVLNRFHNAAISFLLPSVLFSLLHFLNSGYQIVGAVNTFLVAILFTYMTYKTDSLWMAIGYHFVWNWSLSGLFSLNVSGGGQGNGIFGFITVKESILGTWSYGPEGGLLCTFVLISIFLLVYKIHNKAVQYEVCHMEFPELPHHFLTK